MGTVSSTTTITSCLTSSSPQLVIRSENRECARRKTTNTIGHGACDTVEFLVFDLGRKSTVDVTV